MKVGFIGLGTMGAGMAGNLQKAGFSLVVNDINQPLGLPLWADSYGQIDAGIHYKVGKDLTVGLEGSNLTNQTYKQYMQQHIGMMPHNYFTSGRSYTVSMQYSF